MLAGLAAAYVKDLSVFFTSLFNVLPTLVLLLGGAYCAVYRRQRELFLMLTVYIAYFLLDTQTDFYRDNGRVREDAGGGLPPVLPAAALAVRPVRRLAGTHPPVAGHVAPRCRAVRRGQRGGALKKSYPQALLTWLAEIRWPALHGQWMSLIQMVYPLFLGVLPAGGDQYWQPRPLHAAQLIRLARPVLDVAANLHPARSP